MYWKLSIIALVVGLSLCPPLVDLPSAFSKPGLSRSTLSGDGTPRLDPTYGRQTLYFERNDGQVDSRVTHIARGHGYTLFVTKREFVLSLQRSSATTEAARGALLNASRPAATSPLEGRTIRMEIVGGNLDARATSLDTLPGRSNYFIGNDPSKWRTNVPHHAKVRLASVYPGIDLVFYGKGKQLEYDFMVAPGGDPRQIRLAFTGAERVSLTRNGDLALALPGGDLILRAPVAYQDSESVREPVLARFVVADNGQVSFALGHYDPARPLVIDPVLSYSTYLGGGGAYVDKNDWGNGIAVDSAGNAYVVGTAYPPDFPTTAGAFDQSGGYAGFVAKFDPNGTLLYSTFLGGGGFETAGGAIAVDGSGHAYVTGYTHRTDFPTTPGAFQTSCAVGTSHGCMDAFVTKLSPDGSALVYSTYLGGPGSTASGDFGYDYGNGIAIDSQGNAYVTGRTRSLAFPVTPNAFQTTSAGGAADVFIAKVNATGSALGYATYLGGTGGSLNGDEAYAIAVDGQGQAYVTGITTSADFPTTPGAFKPTWSGYTEGFISKLSADGSALAYSTYLGGPGAGRIYGGRGIAVDGAGNAYITGTADDGFPTTPGSYQPQCATAPALCSDAFVLKLNPAGSAPVWSTYLGGSAGEEGRGIALDGHGNVYVAGLTTSPNFPVQDPVQATYGGRVHGGWGDAFVATLSADGSHLLFSTYLGGTDDDAGLGIAVDRLGSVYVAGATWSTDFPTVNAVQASNHGAIDAFVVKLIQSTGILWQHATTGDVYDWHVAGVAVTSGGYIRQGLDLNWNVVGVADVNGDGEPDVLLHNAATGDVYVWYMNGTTVTAGEYITRGIDLAWRIALAADFNSDGHPDLLWQHTTSGDVYVWYMNGIALTWGAYLAHGMAPWKVVATADLNADGKPDLLWQHATSGDVYAWFLNGTALTGGSYLAQGMAPWRLVGSADLNADGQPDLLWQHDNSGDVYVWFMDGKDVVRGAYLAQGMDPWKVVGPK